jgi:hypothetical protein
LELRPSFKFFSQSACDTAADDKAGYPARRIAFCCLPGFADAERGKVQTNAICAIPITSRGKPGAGQGARQAPRPQADQHLQGMLTTLHPRLRDRRRD